MLYSCKVTSKEELPSAVVVIGAGYVGIPLAITASKANSIVILYDHDSDKCKSLQESKSGINDTIDRDLQILQQRNILKICDYITIQQIKESYFIKTIVICVPTPLQNDKSPDLSMVINASEFAINLMNQSTLIILESSTYPGTTREIIYPMIKAKFSDLPDEKILLGYSPERIDPGNNVWNSSNTPRLVSGINELSEKSIENFYGSCGIITHLVKSIEIAEAAKLFENTFRLINIAFVNEFVEVVRRIGLDPQEILEAAYTKPFGIMKFKSSPGIGGHCIPIDPYYLTWWASKFSEEFKIVKAAQEANEDMPNSVLNRVKRQLGNELKGKAVVLIGVTYKPKIRDARETPAEGIWRILEDCGCKLYWWDSLLNEWKGRERFKPSVNEIDLALIVTSTTLDFQLSEEKILDLNL